MVIGNCIKRELPCVFVKRIQPESKIKLLMRYILLFIVSVIGIHNCFSQEKPLKFDDIYRAIPDLKPTQNLYELLKFQGQQPDFSPTYVQIGNLCEEQIANIDPLREYSRAMFWIDNACLYYGLYSTMATKGDVNRNREFFDNIDIPICDKKLKDEDVAKYVKLRLDSCKKYKDNITKIYNDLEHAKEYYSHAIGKFNNLNNRYKNLNDLLLHTNDSLLVYLDSLSADFDVAMQKLQDYKMNLSNYPQENYHQNYSLKKIETFRLDGLTKSDFLENSFYIWDFKSWVENQKKTYYKDIVPLRKEVVTMQDNFLKNQAELLKVDTISSDAHFSSYSDLFLFRLGRYDHSSIVKNLFQYLSAKQKLMVFGDRPVSSGSDDALNLMNIKLRYFYNLIQLQQQVVASVELLKKELTEDKVSRFKEFFSTYYNNYSGLRQFVLDEPDEVNVFMQKCFFKLNSYMKNTESFKESFGSIKYKNDTIALYEIQKSSDADLLNKGYITENVAYYKGLPVFISGYYKNENVFKPFVAQVDTDKIDWLHFPVKGISSDIKFRDLNMYTNGCVSISSSDTNDSVCQIFNYDLKGKLIFTKTIDYLKNPISVKYDELEKEYAIVFGEKMEDSETVQHDLDKSTVYNSFTVLLADSLDNAISLVKIDQKGSYVDLAKLGGNYQLYVNNIQPASQKPKFNLSVSTINKAGEIITSNVIFDSKSYMIDRIFQISNNQMNLIGYCNGTENELVYLIVSDQGKLEYSNMVGKM